jgi:4,5-DOPA dioxygenase extradiol
MILGSGNVVHNLRRVQWDQPEAAFDWAERFDDAVVGQLAADPGGILKVAEHPDYALAVPTPDHFIPLLYVAGLAAAAGEAAEPLVRGYALGSISMTCYGLGVTSAPAVETDGAAGLPRDVPADQTNM